MVLTKLNQPARPSTIHVTTLLAGLLSVLSLITGTLILPNYYFFSEEKNTVHEVDLPHNLEKKRAVIVYIAGRMAGTGDSSLIDELHLSVLSACHAQAQSSINPADNKHLHFVFFVSVDDYNACSIPHSSMPCDFLPIAESCSTQYEHSTFQYAMLGPNIPRLWKEHTGVVGFSHHSTWFGYAKLWLPVLLARSSFSSAMFVDTDTLWNQAPVNIFDELYHFNSSQVIGATSIVARDKGHTNSLSFRNRVTSGVLLFDLDKIRRTMAWADVVKNSITANRGINVGGEIPLDYNQSQYCEGFHWGPYLKPFCLTDPLIPNSDDADLKAFKLSGDESLLTGCRSSRACWKTSPQSGDQEFFSAIFSNSNPELLYELPTKHQLIKMGSWRDFKGFNNDTSMTLIHAPQMPELWDEQFDSVKLDMFPPTARDSLRWFRRVVKNLTVT